MSLSIDKNTILKYDIPGPRYTSYPTAPNWNNDVTAQTYIGKLKDFGNSSKTLSLYIHIPFCRSMCTFCACNVLIRKHEEKHADEYLTYLFKEIDLIASHIGSRKKIKQLHWGGGTPTFLSENQIERLMIKLKENFEIDENEEVAIEIDPRTIDQNKLRKLKLLGFNRISMGIQDFSPEVQIAINRRQPLEMVKEVNAWCRDLNFRSVNFDLIYGLPFQTTQSFQETINHAINLKPDRIALYSFAYVPWLKKHQNKIDPKSLPSNEAKLDIFLMARQQFLKNGYLAIAMDHFALIDDELAKSFNSGKLYRNFMGYTVKPADEYIGLGLTSIGFLENTFIQNHKILAEYYASLDKNQLPVERGKQLSEDDQIRQWTINSLMCQFQLDKEEFKTKFAIEFDQYYQNELAKINRCWEEGLIKIDPSMIKVTELGKLFIRNVCMVFDWYLQQADAHKRFSRTV